MEGLARSGREVAVVDDLCGLAARKKTLLAEWARRPRLTVIACYPRAVRWLFARAEAPIGEDGAVEILNPRTRSPEEILNAVGVGPSGEAGASPEKEEWRDGWEPWFPVIDRDRCRNCKLCLNFCLFGVYSTDDEGRVHVAQPANCKNNCPACARVCPKQAIIFPKLDQAPINGDEVDDSAPVAALGRMDRLQEINVYDMLRQRSQQTTRFSQEPRKSENILEILHRQLDIPMEVLQALSPADLNRIHKKAAPQKESHEP